MKNIYFLCFIHGQYSIFDAIYLPKKIPQLLFSILNNYNIYKLSRVHSDTHTHRHAQVVYSYLACTECW
jgi:hypothetical protein